MEEVDKIIIDSLKHLNCNIDDEITSLKNIEPDLVVEAISRCLESMNPHIRLPKKLPVSMSAKIKFASNLAQQIKDKGFKGDMGYQTILYCNEVEVRRVLMFLIERLPKESSSIATIEPLGYVPRIVKQIEDNLKQSLHTMWLPSEALNYGTREAYNEQIVNSFGNSFPLSSIRLIVPNKNTSPKEFTCIPHITRQCSSRQLIPSLLFQDIEFSTLPNWKENISKTIVSDSISREILYIASAKSTETLSKETNKSQTSDTDMEKNRNEREEDRQLDVLFEQLKEKKESFISLQERIALYEKKVAKIKSERIVKQELLNDLVSKVKVKNRTLAVLNNDENKVKLKKVIIKTENRLIDLKNQWKDVETPLLQEYETLKSSVNSDRLRYQDEQNKLQKLKSTYKEMVADVKEKSVLEQMLIERCKELNNKNNRAVYTKRILEIVGNIKKQNKEIQKVLSDTRQVQKDIKNLTGQVDRSFTLCDELIFFNCKHDESARKAYKYLAALREESNGVLQAVSDIGQAERELRNLEDQVETEKNKEMKIKLEKVQHDLAEIKKEIQLLM